MSNKEIRLKWLSDDSEIDKSIQRLQQKLTQMNRSSAQMQNIAETGGTLSPNAHKAKGAFESSQRAILEKERRELDQTQRKETQFLSQKQRQLERLEKMETRATEAQKERLQYMKEELQLKINMSSDKVLQQEATKNQIDKSLGVDNRGQSGQGGQAGGNDIGSLMGRIAKSLDPAKIASAMIGSARMYGQYLAHEQTREREVQGYQGATVQAGNIGFQDTMSNKGFMRHFEGGERAKAMQMAMAERSARLSGDPIRAAASIGGQALAGGAMGSMIPGVGTAIGAAGGAANAIFGNKGIYRQIFDRDAYKAEVNAQTMQNYRGNIASLRQQDPGKYAAMEKFGAEAGRNQALQRRMGLSDAEMYGGAAVTDEKADLSRRRAKFGDKNQRRIRGADGLAYQYEGDESYNKRIADYQSQSDYNTAFNERRQRGFVDGQMYDRAGEKSFSKERIAKNMQNIFSGGGSSGFVRQDGAQIAAEYQRAGFTNAGKEL